MCDNIEQEGLCGRNEEIAKVREFITSRIKSKKSGILYLTGPPGTGKTMSVKYVLDGIRSVGILKINCARVSSSKYILSSLCNSVDLQKFSNSSESEMISRLTKKFSSRISEPYVILLDEMDQLPKSRSEDLFKKIFSWPEETHSKLILIGIANTVNLTSRYRTICSIIGKDDSHVVKIVFKPYSSNDIKQILRWYLENDENFEDALVDQKAIDLIAMKCSRDRGDIRGALNALRSVLDDVNQQNHKPTSPTPKDISHYPTPPSTPPPITPCKESRTNIASVANSIKKRSKRTNYKDDVFPFQHQVVLTCIQKFCSKSKASSMPLKQCTDLSLILLKDLGIDSSTDDIRCVIDNLQTQGLITLKKGRDTMRLMLLASECELTSLIQRKDMILTSLKKYA